MSVLPKRAAITFNKLYRNKILIAEDVTVEIPEVMLKTATVNAMGDMNVPLTGVIDGDIEVKITKVGVAYEMNLLDKPELADYKLCNVQQLAGVLGEPLQQQIKICFKGVGKGVAGLSFTPGESTSNDHTIICHRVQTYVDGIEYALIDRLQGVYKIGGTDYMLATKAMLI